MNHQREQATKPFVHKLRVVAFAVLYAGLSCWTGLWADDSQIYINKLPAAQTPNVLFTIDTSGSMGSLVPNSSQTRMEAVKDALKGLVNETSNLKAGLGRFHYELGGPIVFPVVDLDETPSFLNDPVSVSSIDRSSDDAEESADFIDIFGQEVLLDSTSLEMTEINTGDGGSPVMVTYKPLQSSDDDEHGSGSATSIASPDLDLGQVNAGIRFPGVDIPKDAIILHAEIEFQATGQASSDNTDVDIFGHAVDDSPTFSDSGSDQVNQRFSDATDAQVVWSNIVDVAEGDRFTTPNIRSIIQEIVSRDDWSPSNALTILMDRERGHHTPATFDNDIYAAPELRIRYVDSGTVVERTVDRRNRDAAQNLNNNGVFTPEPQLDLMDRVFANSHVGLIFRDVPIPDDAVVAWADIRFTTRDEETENPADMAIHGIENPDLSGFANSTNFISDLPMTNAYADWIGDFKAGDEEIFAPEEEEPLWTPNLAATIEEIRTDTSFSSGDYLGFVIKDADDSDPRANRSVCSYDGVREADDCPESHTARPTLRLVYTFPTAATSTTQQVGLRFNNVRVPQGATIDSAHLEFTVDAESTTPEGGDPESLTIEIENNTEPVTYSNTSGEEVSDRSYGASTSWQPDAWNTIGETKQSPDISTLVSSVTNQTEWCGGGSLAFRITGDEARRIAQSYDKGETGAPRLRVEYSTDNLGAGEGCTVRQTSVSINDEDNDVEEDRDGWGFGSIDFNSGDLDLYNDYLVGLRFEDVQVPTGASILDTNLYLTGDDFDTGTNNITIQAQQHANAPPFIDSYQNVSNRVESGGPSVVWSVEQPWKEDGIYSAQDDGTDLTPLIQGIIDGSSIDGNEVWSAGNALVFTLDSDATSSSGDRQAEVCCGADPPARLEIFYQVNLGDVDGSGQVTGRQAMLDIIDELVANGFTPPVDALFEAGSYFQSAPVHFGRTRGAGQSYESTGPTNDGDLDSQIDGHWDSQLLAEAELSRLSHFATYTPQTASIEREGSCTELDPNNRDCRTEHISNSATSVDYVSPFEGAEKCEKGFMVLLSDGIANRNSSRDLIQGLTGRGSCPMEIPQISPDTGEPYLDGGGNFDTRNPSSDEMCGLELVDYMHEKDYIEGANDETDVLNNIRTFTIGFDLDTQSSNSNRGAVEFLKALAFVGNGGDLDDPDGVNGVQYGDGFYTASNAEELQSVIEVIVNEIIQETTSFVAPGLSINAFNRLFNLNDIYFSLFRPDERKAWLGNLKKFKLCTSQSGCDFGETVDRNADPAVHDDENDLESFGTLKTAAKGFWSGDTDSAPEIDQGGAGELIPTYTERNVYVNTSDQAVPDPDYAGDSVSEVGQSPHKVDLSQDTGSAPDDTEDFADLKSALYGAGNCSGNTMEEINTCLNELIEWITGKKFPGDLSRDGTDEDVDRWAFGDPMHSRPLVLTYGRDGRGTTDNPDDDMPLSKIFVGTNDGGIRMINEGDGIEEWIFFPHSMLGVQEVLRENPTGSHEYGIDDTPAARINDEDDDGIIEPGDGDFVHIYFGLRRGGRQLFALNVTPDSTITLDESAAGGGRPDLNAGADNEFKVSVGDKGKIEPEILWRIDGTAPDFARLANTWSTPRPVRILIDSGPRSVLIFGGGYNTSQDGVDDDTVTPDGGDNYSTPDSGDSSGNAIFIVDANTGERLWWASSDSTADEVVAAMNTSIAAPVTTLDTNGDSLADRVYAVDMRGQIFRIDLKAKPSPESDESFLGNSTVGVLAALGPDESAIPDGEQPPNVDRRKFFYAPEVARVQDTAIVEESYELIGVLSGNRAQPQGKTVQDRAYAVRDFLTENPDGGLTDSNFPKCNPRPDATNCPATAQPIKHSHLNNVTNNSNFVIRKRNDNESIMTVDSNGDAFPDSSGNALDDLRQSHGWYFELEGLNISNSENNDLSGEKGFSGATVLDGKMVFTTFLPPEEADAESVEVCAAPAVPGTSRFYAVDFFTGAPAFDHNSDGGFEKTERFTGLGTGPSADIVPAYLPGGIVLPAPTSAGALPQDPEIEKLVNKTFWLEEQ